MQHRPRITATCARLALLAALLSAPIAFASDAPPRVSNPAEPPNGIVTYDLGEQWRRGDEDDELFFGLVVQAVIGPDDNIYLLDSQLNEVFVLSPGGELLRSIGREGEGPGEFRRPGDLMLATDGNIGVVQRFPGSIVLLTPDGTPAGTILPGDPTTGGRDMLSGARAVAGGVVLSGAHMTRTDNGRLRRNFISLYGPDGIERTEYHGGDDTIDFSATHFNETDGFFPGEGHWNVGPDGRIYIAETRNAYEITIHAPEGVAVATFGREYASWPRTPEMLERRDKRWKTSRPYQRFGVEQTFAEHEPDILRMEMRDNEIWILASRGVHDQPPGVLQTWDVFDTDGRFDRQVSLRGPGDSERDRVIILDATRVLVVSGFQDARDALDGTGDDSDNLEYATPVEVIAYAIR
jgi:hypothetical protein